MDFVKVLMRYFAYVYHGLLALFLLGISTVALASRLHTLHLDMLPWTGAALTYWVFSGALVGLAAVVLAMKGKARVLLLAWSAVVFVLMVKGYVFSPFYFERGGVGKVLWLIGGALVALAGSWYGFRAAPSYKKRY